MFVSNSNAVVWTDFGNPLRPPLGFCTRFWEPGLRCKPKIFTGRPVSLLSFANQFYIFMYFFFLLFPELKASDGRMFVYNFGGIDVVVPSYRTEPDM